MIEQKTLPALAGRNIYAVEAGDIFGLDPGRIYMVYAPLNGRITLATADSVLELEKTAAGDSTTDEALLEQLSGEGNIPVHRLPATPHDLYQVDILPNYTCNFQCTYCYSARGRSAREVDFSHVKALVDHLFDPSREQKTPYKINFSGGGEPLVSFPLVRRTVEYIEQVTAGRSYLYELGMVTNGSLATPEIVEFLKEKKIELAVSFEILKRFQDMERGSYDRVAANIDMMLDMGLQFGIRTTFTPEAVPHMTEMVEELSRRFPRIHGVVFDTLLSADMLDSPEALTTYYENFHDHYFAAKQRGKELGIMVGSIAIETMTILRERTCEGKIVLTPEGTLSSCARVSSPLESLYDEYIYGRVEDGGVVFDQPKFAKITSENNIYTQEICRECFARWNCGAGCRLFHQSFPPEFLAPKCEFTRRGLRRQMYDSLSEKFAAARGIDLGQYIEEQIRSGQI